MKLSGHYQITRKAVVEFLQEYHGGKTKFEKRQMERVTYHNTPHTGVHTTRVGVADKAVMRDLIDVITLGHWSNFAQKHHFMRQFDGQSPFQAYSAGCSWIQTNAKDFANAALRNRGSSSLQNLGNACHALEDSFAHGHAVREKPVSETSPGAIRHVKIYAGKEKENHSHHDKTWEKTGGGLSAEGRLAKNAVKALLSVVFDAVGSAHSSKQKTVTSLHGWATFKNVWLKASPKLSRKRDFAYDLIDKFYNGVVWGDTQTALNFDEAGLAKAVLTHAGSDMQKVHDVFKRLDDYHTVDADDVALEYVNLLKPEPSSLTAKSLARSSKTKAILIRVMDEGWTSSEEHDAIAFIRGLK